MAVKKPLCIYAGKMKELQSGDTLPGAGGGGGSTAGEATIDFGSFPGSSDTSLAVTGQTSIAADSKLNAWIVPKATADHSADEHILETIKVFAGKITPGTGFMIFGVNASQLNEPNGRGTRIFGQWNVQWQWQ